MSPIIEHPEILLHPRIRTSPFFDASRRHGAMHSVYGHTYHPEAPRRPGRGVPALLNGVTLWDVGVGRQVEIAGRTPNKEVPKQPPRDARTDAAGVVDYGSRPRVAVAPRIARLAAHAGRQAAGEPGSRGR